MEIWYFIAHSKPQNTSNMGCGYTDSEYIIVEAETYGDAYAAALERCEKWFGITQVIELQNGVLRNWDIEPITEKMYHKLHVDVPAEYVIRKNKK